jgi:hypothetical protein
MTKIKKCWLICGIVFVSLWFIGIALLHMYKEIVIVPVFKVIGDYRPEEMTRNEAPVSSEYADLMGLDMALPFSYEEVKSVSPVFMNHQLHSLALTFMGKEKTRRSSILLDRFPDEVKGTGGLSFNALLNLFTPEARSLFEFEKAIQYARVKDFSWWNLVYDIRLMVLLTQKAIRVPAYQSDRVFFLETPYLSGILSEGKKLGNNKTITDFKFRIREAYYFLTFIMVDEKPEKIRSSVGTIREGAMRNIAKAGSRYPEELLLLSRIFSDGTSIQNLTKLLNSMERKDYDLKIQERVKAELEFLKNSKNN